MKNKYEIAVKEAKKYLKNPRDITHDLMHHKAVWDNCKKIIDKENLTVNNKLVKVCAFWHDVIIGDKPQDRSLDDVLKAVSYLENFLPKKGFNEQETRTIIEAVKYHEFKDKPVNVEGLILQDADKLDVLSKERWERTVKNYRSGKMSKEKITSYIKTGLKWLPIIESTFHFKASRKIAKKEIKNVYGFLTDQKIIKDLGLEKEKENSEQENNSFKTKIKRILIRLRYLNTEISLMLKML